MSGDNRIEPEAAGGDKGKADPGGMSPEGPAPSDAAMSDGAPTTGGDTAAADGPSDAALAAGAAVVAAAASAGGGGDPAPAAARPAPAAVSPATPAPAPKPRSSLLTRALAALGLVLGGGIGALSFADSLPPAVTALFGLPAAGGDPALSGRVEALAGGLAAAQADAGAARTAAEAAGAEAAGAAARIGDLDSGLADLAARLAAVEAGGGASGSGDPALAGRVAEAESALKALRAEIGALAARLEDGLANAGAAAPEEYEARIAALEEGQREELAWRELAEEQAEAARRYAAVSAALGQIDRAMTLGTPFPEALEDLAAAAEAAPPEALAAAAARGAPTREALKATFPQAAYAAIEAALVGDAEKSDQALAGVIARIQAKVTGLPTEAVAGDSAPAVLSRARMALFNGDLDAALAGIAALPAEAQAAMADWVEGATLRSAADAALANWRAELAGTL